MELIKLEKLYDDRLWVISIHESNQKAVDEWEACVREYMANAPNTNRYLVYDTTGNLRFGFTPYLQSRSTALAKDNPDVTGRVAIVLNLPATFRSLIESYQDWIGARLQPNLTVKFFDKRDIAVQWVAEIIPSTNNTATTP